MKVRDAACTSLGAVKRLLGPAISSLLSPIAAEPAKMAKVSLSILAQSCYLITLIQIDAACEQAKEEFAVRQKTTVSTRETVKKEEAQELYRYL